MVQTKGNNSILDEAKRNEEIAKNAKDVKPAAKQEAKKAEEKKPEAKKPEEKKPEAKKPEAVAQVKANTTAPAAKK